MSNMVERIGISLEKKLLAQFDRLIAERGYSNRSEAVRDLIREKLVEREWAIPEGEAVATVLLVYEHETMDLSRRLARMEHEDFHHVVSTLHVHMDHVNCMEVIVLRGPGRALKKFADRLISLRGVKVGRFIPGTSGKNV